MQDTQSSSSAALAERDQAFARMFSTGELIWQVGELYDPQQVVWRIDFLRQGRQGTWMYQRYHYDVDTGVIYFMGERPVSEEELPVLRRAGRVFPTATDA